MSSALYVPAAAYGLRTHETGRARTASWRLPRGTQACLRPMTPSRKWLNFPMRCVSDGLSSRVRPCENGAEALAETLPTPSSERRLPRKRADLRFRRSGEFRIKPCTANHESFCSMSGLRADAYLIALLARCCQHFTPPFGQSASDHAKLEWLSSAALALSARFGQAARQHGRRAAGLDEPAEQQRRHHRRSAGQSMKAGIHAPKRSSHPENAAGERAGDGHRRDWRTGWTT